MKSFFGKGSMVFVLFFSDLLEVKNYFGRMTKKRTNAISPFQKKLFQIYL